MSALTCPLCGLEQDPAGPGVTSMRDHDTGEWKHWWTPFIDDLRGTPPRLVHPRCFAEEHGVEALVALVTAHDLRMRAELARHRRA